MKVDEARQIIRDMQLSPAAEKKAEGVLAGVGEGAELTDSELDLLLAIVDEEDLAADGIGEAAWQEAKKTEDQDGGEKK